LSEQQWHVEARFSCRLASPAAIGSTILVAANAALAQAPDHVERTAAAPRTSWMSCPMGGHETAMALTGKILNEQDLERPRP
jgi:hypothetical protein